MLNTLLHQSSMQELDLMNPQIDRRITYTGGPKWHHGSNGLLREAPVNLLLYATLAGGGSAPTGWTKVFPSDETSTPVVSANAGLGATAYQQTATAARPFLTSTGVSVLANTVYVASMRIEAVSGSLQVNNLMWFGSLPAGATVAFRLNGVSVADSASPAVGLLEAVVTIGANAGLIGMRAGLGTVAAATGSVTFSCPQIERGSVSTNLLQWLPTTTATLAAWPLEYDPITLAPIGRSVWEARTNLLTYSEFPNGVTDAPTRGGSVTGTSLPSWLGHFTTGLAFPSGITSFAYKNQSYVAGQKYVLSFFLAMDDGGVPVGGVNNASYDFGVVMNNTLIPAASITATHLGGGVYRVSALHTAVDGSSNTGVIKYSTQTARPFKVTGYQLEQAATAGPYIPTQASQVTRTIEAPVATGIQQALRFHPNAQTVLIEYSYPAAIQGQRVTFAQIDDGDSTLDDDWLLYSNNANNQFACRLYPGGSHTGTRVTTPDTVIRGATAADATGATGTINGEAPASGPNGCSQVGMQRIYFGRSSAGSGAEGVYIRRMRFYPARLSAAEVQAMTL